VSISSHLLQFVYFHRVFQTLFDANLCTCFFKINRLVVYLFFFVKVT
jgi:hypothetical protein